MNTDNIQSLIHQMETGKGQRILAGFIVLLLIIGFAVIYDVRDFHCFSAPEAMDAAQVGRNLAQGHGFSTECVRPFSIYLMQEHNRAKHPDQVMATNGMDLAEVSGAHPDLANAPVYPMVLAGLFRTMKMDWKVETDKRFWSRSGQFERYQPEFRIALMNQVLLLLVVLLTFFIAWKLFDLPAAGLAAVLTVGSDLLWKFSVSGLSTMLLLVIFLAVAWCVIQAGEWGRTPEAGAGKVFLNGIALGLLVGLGMLTRYSFGWLIIPVAVFVGLFGGFRRVPLVVLVCVVFALTVSPWLVRNLAVSGTPFGTAGYALVDQTAGYSGNILMQSLDLHLDFSISSTCKKVLGNSADLLKGNLLTTGGWAGLLFFAGLLLGLRNVAARHIRYFALASLGVLLVVQAGGQTNLTTMTPVYNSENLLVLVTPLMNVFGAVFFLTLLDQMKAPGLAVRYAVTGGIVLLVCLPLVTTACNRMTSLSFPPYYPPEIQKFCGWMKPDELIMSDAPWAVAWYGDHQCVMTTLNPQDEYANLDFYVKPIHAVYLTPLTTDAKMFTEGAQSPENSWAKLAFRVISGTHEPSLSPSLNPAQFVLTVNAWGQLYGAGIFLTDHPRW